MNQTTMWATPMPPRNAPSIPQTAPMVGEPQVKADTGKKRKHRRKTDSASEQKKDNRKRTRTQVGFEMEVKLPLGRKTKTTEKEKETKVNKKQNRNRGLIDAGGSVPKLSTPIQSKTFINQYKETVDQGSLASNASCVINCGEMSFVGKENSDYLTEYFNSHVYPTWLSIAQARVNWNVVGTNNPYAFTDANLATAMRTISDALQLYYCVDAIIAFESKGLNRNRAVDKMYSDLITADVLLRMDDLRRQLEGCIISPQIVYMCRWFYQFYKTNELSTTTLLKQSYQVSLINATSDNITPSYNNGLLELLDSTVNSLLQPNIVSINSIMRRCAPEWVIGTLPESDKMAKYDPNFYTFFNNSQIGLSVTLNSNNREVFPYAANQDAYISYVSWLNEDELDGTTYALAGIATEASVPESPKQQLGAFVITPDSFIDSTYSMSGVPFYVTTKWYVGGESDSYQCYPLISAHVGNGDDNNSRLWNGLETLWDLVRNQNGTYNKDTSRVPATGNILQVHTIRNLKQCMQDYVNWVHSLDQLSHTRP